jgi:hypothetical protein
MRDFACFCNGGFCHNRVYIERAVAAMLPDQSGNAA